MNTEKSNEELNQLLKMAGVSKTIYSLVMPETEDAFSDVVDGKFSLGKDDATSRDVFFSLFREGWTQKQDVLHESFFFHWRKWTEKVVRGDWEQFPYRYPTAGASEGLRDLISSYGNRARVEGFVPQIRVFTGEYEGYAAYARANYIPIFFHARGDWGKMIDATEETDQVYLSNPSAIDGNVWDDFELFARELYRLKPKAEIILDLTYVGCVGRDFSIPISSPNIKSVVFSLSKPLGAYYHRIGGCFSRVESLGLFGNKWFKNITSLALGEAMMRLYDVQFLPRKYAEFQKKAIGEFSKKAGFRLDPCDVFLLGAAKMPKNPTPLQEYLFRDNGEGGLVRACLTPTMAGLVDPRLNTEVRARSHEGRIGPCQM